MPLILKARRRPGWQDTRPARQAQRGTYRVAAEHEPKFRNAFRRAVRESLSDDVLGGVERALRQSLSVPAALEAVPLYDPANRDAEPWASVRRILDQAFVGVIEDAGTEADKTAGITRKQEEPFRSFDPARRSQSLLFIESQTGDLIRRISEGQLSAIKVMVEAGIEQGLNPRRIVRNIRGVIGLLPREIDQVLARREFLLAQGFRGEPLERAVARFHTQLLNRRAENIARTEMIAAEAEGRLQAWRGAQREGLLPQEVMRLWIAAVGSDRTCPICIDLDGKTATLDGSYESIKGPIARPPAHPRCRCSESIQVQ